MHRAVIVPIRQIVRRRLRTCPVPDADREKVIDFVRAVEHFQITLDDKTVKELLVGVFSHTKYDVLR